MNGNYTIMANFAEHLPKICVSPSSLHLSVAPNTTVTITYTITNCGGGTLHWDSSNVTYVPNGNMTWFSQNITSGSLTANASQTVLVTVNTTGLAVGKYTATITITGSTFILDIILDVTYIDVMRDLPGNNLMPNQTYPGATFDVYVNFTATADKFNAISLTDLAPDGWKVAVDPNWTPPPGFPNPDKVEANGNKVEFGWYGETGVGFDNGTNFSAKYSVTVPKTAKPGENYWPYNSSTAWLEFYFGEDGPYLSNITGDYKMIVVVPGFVVGETRDVNANLLPDVKVTLEKGDNITYSPIGSDESTPDYSIICYDTGMYWLNASKYRYISVDTPWVANADIHPGSPGWNINHTRYIDWSTPEKLAHSYHVVDGVNMTDFDFEGDYGLVPMNCTFSYAMRSVNLWLFWPTANEEWGLSGWKASQSIHSWQYPG